MLFNRKVKVEDSSNIAGLAYSFKDEILLATFKNGKKYLYHGVPAEDFGSLVSANSVGKHLNAEIKPNYKYEEI